MDILSLKYVVEVEKTRSISKAAENLLMGQPNLSRAIKELEESLGVILFNRTSKGITLTLEGEEFLQYAKKILSEVYEIEAKYKNKREEKQVFSISVPRASYIACAFTEFAKFIDTKKKAEIFYKETNSKGVVNNILQSGYKLGIIRYQKIFEKNFNLLLRERGLSNEIVKEFSCKVIMSKNHPLAKKENIKMKDFCGYIEIGNDDSYVPSVPLVETKKAEFSEIVDKHIFIFERGSQFELLSNVTNTFMWTSAIPDDLLSQYGLVQRDCEENKKIYRDVLIYRKDYHFTDLDHRFISCLNSFKNID